MSTRERKRPAHLEDEIGEDEFKKSIREWQKSRPPLPKKKPVPEVPKEVAIEAPKQPVQIVRMKNMKGKNQRGEPAQAPAMTPQARLQEEIEEKHIARSRDRRSKSSKAVKLLPEGAVEIPDIKTATRRGVKECSTLLLDWTSPKAKMIGGLCKVYWDGENTWFYARILNYDSYYDRHYIYYLEDSTAEWISLENEIVLVAEEMVLARLNPGGAPWAAQRFWVSDKAKAVCHNFPGFHKGGEYVEYMTEASHKEYAFLQRKCLDPMQDKYMPKKPSAAFKKGMKAAELEQQEIDEVLDLMKAAIRDYVFTALSGEQWVGHRVRASTHRIVQLGESRSVVLEQGSAYSAGRVALFQPGSGEHLVIFDDPLLQPQWVVCQKSCIDVLLGADEAGHAESTSSGSGSSGGSDAISTTSEPVPHLHPLGDKAVDYSHQCACALCQGELAHGSYKRCEKCDLKCHTYCVPEEAVVDAAAATQQWAAASNLPWTCWNCIVCFGCSEPSWNKSLLAWNAQRVEPEGPDLDMSVCGDCLYRYKYVKDFCPACFKPYATDESMLPLHGPLVVVPDSAGAAASAVEPVVKAEPTEMPAESSVAIAAGVVEEGGNVAESTEGESMETDDATTTTAVISSSSDTVAPASVPAPAEDKGSSSSESNVLSEDSMVECNECSRWVHAHCEGIDKAQYDAMTLGTHPIWGDEYLCPLCRVKLSKVLIRKMAAQDQYGMFAEPVTEKVARNYYDVIRNPMDLATMSSKARRGLYKSLQALRQDFELMCLNAMVFNTSGDEYWREARRFNEEVQHMFRLQKRKSHASAYGFELQQLITAHDAAQEALRVSKLQPKKRKNNATGGLEAGEEVGSNYSGPKRTKLVSDAGTTSAGSEVASETATEAGDVPSLQSLAVPVVLNNKDKTVPANKPDPDEGIVLDDCVYLPTVLAPSPDPSSFLPCTVVSQSVEEAYYLMCQDVCLVCGAAGRSEVMLFCVDCGEAVHTFCSDAPLSLMSEEARASWRCMNCKFCKVCSTSAENESVGKMLYCEGCDEAYHGNCLSPRLGAPPENSWYCADCVKCATCDMGHGELKCWGFETNACYGCVLLEQRRQAAAAEEARLRELELERRKDPANCNTCFLPCTVPFMMCSACGRNSHVTCNPANTLPAVKNDYECFRDYLCLSCSTEHMPSCVSHLGTGAPAAVLLTMVARIQRKRKVNKLEAQLRTIKTLETERAALFESQRNVFKAVLHLATLRLRWYETNPVHVPQIPKLLPQVNSAYISSRAMRFLAVWRRRPKGQSTPVGGSSNKKRLDCVLEGLDDAGKEMSAERLVRVAVLAASYLVATAADVRLYVTKEDEVAPAVLFLSRLFQSDPQTPLTSEEEKAVAAAGVMAMVGLDVHATSSTATNGNASAPEGTEIVANNAAVTRPIPPPSPLVGLLESCVEKLVRAPIGVDLGDVPPAYTAGTQVFSADVGKKGIVVPWKPGNIIISNLLSRTPRPAVPAAAFVRSPGPSSTMLNSPAARQAYAASAQLELLTVDLSQGDGFYARKARLCGLVRREPLPERDRNEINSLLRRQDVRVVAEAVDTARDGALKEASARAAAAELETLRIRRYGPAYPVLAAVVEDLVARVEKRFKVSPNSSGSGSASAKATGKTAATAPQLVQQVVVPVIDFEDEEEVELCLPCDTFNPSDFTFVATPAKAMAGWEESEAAAERQWTDPRSCCLCLDSREDSVVGRLIPSFDGFFTHVNCLRWSPEVVESDGVLHNAIAGRERALKTGCFYCTRKGATVCCNKRKCRRAFHVRCAIMCRCAMLETKPTNTAANKPHDISMLGLCSEHIPLLKDISGYTQLWKPYDPVRSMLIVENQDANFTADLLAQRRSDKAIRAGALTVYALGRPVSNSAHFYDRCYIYPHRFRSARIYWSMVAPLQRTLYTFEIFQESDFEQLEASKVDYIRSVLEHNDRLLRRTKPASEEDSDWEGGERPIFRIVALDNASAPVFTHSLEQAFQLVAQGVQDCNRHHNGAFSRCKLNRTRTADSFGFSAHQFCGLGLPFVRKAIEMLPESLNMIVTLNREDKRPLYAPVYKLPTKESVVKLQQQLLRAQEGTSASINGCARADGFGQSEKRFVGKRVTRILSKVADVGESAKAAKTELNQYELREDEDENKRVNEALKSRYREMTAAYLHNPHAKLDVRKSGIHGWGLFAKINFERNDIIVEYIGQKIRQVVADRREAQYEDEGVGSCYLFRLDKEDIIDATRRGGMARFMNHCCEPNAYARVIITNSRPAPGAHGEDSVVEEKHIIIIAARDIQEGEEVTYDYKFPIEDSKLKCYCGASCCGGFMN